VAADEGRNLSEEVAVPILVGGGGEEEEEECRRGCWWLRAVVGVRIRAGAARCRGLGGGSRGRRATGMTTSPPENIKNA
jgi:hypothetical protein